MSQSQSVRVTISQYQWAALIALALVSALPAWAIRHRGMVVPLPALQLVLRNHADDFAAVLLATVLLLIAGSAAGVIWRLCRLPRREVGATTARLRRLAAPLLATAAEAWVEVGQRTGGPFTIYTHPLGVWQSVGTFAGHKLDGVFDPWDLVTIGIAGTVCGLIIAWPPRAATMRRPAPATPALIRSHTVDRGAGLRRLAPKSRHERVWRMLRGTVAVGAVVMATAAASGGTGGSSGNSSAGNVTCEGDASGIRICLEEYPGPRNPRVNVQVQDGTDWTDIFGRKKPPTTQGRMTIRGYWKGQLSLNRWNELRGAVDDGQLGGTTNTRFSLFREGPDVNLKYEFEAQPERLIDGQWKPVGNPIVLRYVSRLARLRG